MQSYYFESIKPLHKCSTRELFIFLYKPEQYKEIVNEVRQRLVGYKNMKNKNKSIQRLIVDIEYILNNPYHE